MWSFAVHCSAFGSLQCTSNFWGIDESDVQWLYERVCHGIYRWPVNSQQRFKICPLHRHEYWLARPHDIALYASLKNCEFLEEFIDFTGKITNKMTFMCPPKRWTFWNPVPRQDRLPRLLFSSTIEWIFPLEDMQVSLNLQPEAFNSERRKPEEMSDCFLNAVSNRAVQYCD